MRLLFFFFLHASIWTWRIFVYSVASYLSAEYFSPIVWILFETLNQKSKRRLYSSFTYFVLQCFLCILYTKPIPNQTKSDDWKKLRFSSRCEHMLHNYIFQKVVLHFFSFVSIHFGCCCLRLIPILWNLYAHPTKKLECCGIHLLSDEYKIFSAFSFWLRIRILTCTQFKGIKHN